MKNILLYLFLLFPILSWGQIEKQYISTTSPIYPTQPTKVSIEPSTKQLMAELEGSFRIETSQPDYNVLFTRELLETIKHSRKATEEVRLVWDDNATIVITPSTQLPNAILEPSKSKTNE